MNFHILKLIFVSIFCWHFRYFIGTNNNACQLTCMYCKFPNVPTKLRKKHYGEGAVAAEPCGPYGPVAHTLFFYYVSGPPTFSTVWAWPTHFWHYLFLSHFCHCYNRIDIYLYHCFICCICKFNAGCLIRKLTTKHRLYLLYYYYYFVIHQRSRLFILFCVGGGGGKSLRPSNVPTEPK